MAQPPEHAERGGPLGRRLGLGFGVAAFCFLLFGPDLGLTPLQRGVAATTALTATLWITVALPVGVTSLLPAILFPLLGVMPASDVAPVYMRDLVMLFIGAFIIALGLERWGVHRRMALAIVARMGTARPNLVLGFMCASAFLSMWINNTATTLLMLPIAMAVIGSLETKSSATSTFPLALLLGIAYSASVGGMGTPVGTAPNQEFLGQFADRFPNGPKLSFGDWFLAFAPLVVCFIPVAWLLLTRVIFRFERAPSPEAARVIQDERASQGKMSVAQRRMSWVFFATAVLWVTRADLVLGPLQVPGWTRLFMGDAALDPAWYRAHKNDISDSTVATFMAFMCFLIPASEGRGSSLMDWRTAVRLPWDVLLLLGGGFCLARGFRVSELDQVLGAQLSGFFAGTSPWLLVLLVAAFMSLLTEMTSNTATTAVLLPVIAAAAVEAGVNPLGVMMPATIAASAAFMMPVATPPNAVVFSSQQITVPQMARAGLLINIATIILITLVFQLWVRPFLGIEAGLPAWAAR